MKGTKGSETKALIRETAFKQFLTKDYSMVPLKDIEKSLNLSRGCTSYHYPTKQELFIDVINVYILDVQRVKHASDNLSGLSLFEYFNQYVDNIAKAMDRLSQFVMPEANINGTRAYMSLILQAEKYYPGFHQMLSEIEKNRDGAVKTGCCQSNKRTVRYAALAIQYLLCSTNQIDFLG